MENNELKPCPFCGGKAALTVLETGVSVICWKCRARTAERMDSLMFSEPSHAVQDVIKKWNRRADDGREKAD